MDSDLIITQIIREVSQAFNINFEGYKEKTLTRRIEKRMAIRQITSLSDYLTYLRANPDEKSHLLNDFLINVTHFFRDTEAFSDLRSLAFPRLLKNAKQSVRFWVIGCSTGEEAYSMAMLFDDYLHEHGIEIDYKIFATDVDKSAIDIANKGLFTKNIEKDVPSYYLEHYFIRNEGGYCIKKEIRERIIFIHHNILKDTPFIRIDFVSCRNVLIYIDTDMQSKVLMNIQFALNQGGIFFTGPSESLGKLECDFDILSQRWKIFSNKATRKMPSLELIQQYSQYNSAFATPVSQPIVSSLTANISKERLFSDYLLRRSGSSFLFVDVDGHIHYTNGNVGALLQVPQGSVDFTLNNVTDKRIAALLKMALQRCLVENCNLDLGVNLFENRGEAYNISIEQAFSEQAMPYFCIEFKPEQNAGIQNEVMLCSKLDEVMQQRMHLLERELHETKEKLQLLVEQLNLSNEELQSSNEELVSANEELQGSNEELYSINNELQCKNQELHLLNNEMNNFLRCAPVGVLYLDTQLRIQKFNPPIERFFNIIREDIGRPISAFTSSFDESTRLDIISMASEVLENDISIERECVDSKQRYYLVRISPFVTTQNKLEGCVIIIDDINVTKRMQTQLTESEHKYELLFNSMTNGFAYHQIIVDEDGYPVDYKYLEVNKAFEQLIGKKRSQIIGHSVKDVLTSENHWIESFGSVALHGKAIEFNNYSKALSKYFHVYAFSPKKGYFALVFSDITKMKETEHRLEAAMKHAEESDRLKTAFLANMSHEIRTPMNGILGFSRLLRSNNLPDAKRNHYTDIIISNGNHLLQLINDIIDISRIEADELVFNEERCNVNSLLLEVYNSAIGNNENRLSIQIHTPELDHKMWIMIDPLRLRQVLQNIIGNALKYTNKGSVVIGYNLSDKDIVFYVKDTGAGIPVEKFNSIFERFQQLEPHRQKHNKGGTGLGLTISKRLVERFGGNIWLESELNVGSTFYFSIPYRPSTVEVAPAVNASEIINDTFNLENQTVLIAEDNDYNFWYLEEVVLRWQARVLRASTGQEVLTLLEKHRDVSLLLLDVDMPEMNGIDALKQLRKTHPLLPVIAQTAYAMNEDKKKCFEAGCNDYISKPIDTYLLMNKIRNVMSNEVPKK